MNCKETSGTITKHFRMPLSQEQKVEYDLYQSEVERQSPNDILQFSANYFNKRLEQQRVFMKNQEAFALSKGITLFSRPSRSESVAAASTSIGGNGEERDVLFKSPLPIRTLMLRTRTSISLLTHLHNQAQQPDYLKVILTWVRRVVNE